MDFQYNYSLDTEIEEEVRPKVGVGTERLISRGQNVWGRSLSSKMSSQFIQLDFLSLSFILSLSCSFSPFLFLSL